MKIAVSVISFFRFMLLMFSVLNVHFVASGRLRAIMAREEGPSRFSAVDIYVDSKSAPLAAYQIEFSATNGIARIVGIEGGDSEAFHEPPFYDAKRFNMNA